MLPFVVCLCPTYRRPNHLLNNAIACFLGQDYPEDCRHLLILDDSGNRQPQKGKNWTLVSVPTRYPSLPEKYNELFRFTSFLHQLPSIIFIWEDDDIYLPWHISSAVRAMDEKKAIWSKPFNVQTIVSGRLNTEADPGRFHASLALTTELVEGIGGWPLTKEAQFDLMLIRTLHSLATPADPCRIAPPSYVFRWETTGSYHGQAYGKGPTDQGWYDRIPKVAQEIDNPGPLEPAYDEDALRWFPEHLANRLPSRRPDPDPVSA